jgi:L-aspartate oxidase
MSIELDMEPVPRYLIDVDIDALPRVKKDVVILGGGVAGLFSALKMTETHDVLMITKKSLYDSNTRFAQGGIAAVISSEDSPLYHRVDTLIAGAGLCNTDAVDVLVNEGPSRVRELVRMGTHFDQESDGDFALTKEGAHSQRRILHANGDATGYEIVRALSEKAVANERIEIWEHHFAVDIVTHDGECCGLIVQKPDGSRIMVEANATVICSGGAGQLFRYTTNPEVATGDGFAMAYRAGADLQDVEFIQFHPTVLTYPGAPRFLISEAVRGEGAVLRNIKGERFMQRYDDRLELAPRDIVARAIVSEMEATGSTYIFLDISHESPEMVKHRFPTIYAHCLQYGLDLTTDWVPVAPAAHYMMGGIRTGLHGETNIPRLYACGECTSTGVHGANRLASNSLSEAIVFGQRIVNQIRELEKLPDNIHYGLTQIEKHRKNPSIQAVVEKRLKLQKIMLREVGLRRDEKGMTKGLEELKRHMPYFRTEMKQTVEYEFANMLTLAMLITEAALMRQESRGAHYRLDFPNTDDVTGRHHVLINRKEGVRQVPIVDDSQYHEM